MHIKIEMGSRIRDSKVFIDGCQVTRGIMGIDFDLSDGIPVVMLRIWPEKLEVTGENSDIELRTTYEILHKKRYRRAFKKNLIYCISYLFRWIRAGQRKLYDMWREQHPYNHKLFKIYK